MKNYKAILAFIFIILLTITGIVFSGMWKDKTTVKGVELYGNTTLSKEEIFDYAKLTDSIIGTGTLSLDVIESRIAKHPNIKKVNVVRESATVKIEVSEKNPFAIVTNGKDMFLLDDQLSLYPLKKEQRDIDLPVISGVSAQFDMTNFGKDDMKDLKIAQYIISSAIKMNRSLYHYISEISFADSTAIVVYTSDDAVPVYLLDYNSVRDPKGNIANADIGNAAFKRVLDKKLIYFNSFLKQVRVYKTNNSFAYIDMRYNDMVIVKNNKMPVTD